MPSYPSWWSNGLQATYDSKHHLHRGDNWFGHLPSLLASWFHHCQPVGSCWHDKHRCAKVHLSRWLALLRSSSKRCRPLISLRFYKLSLVTCCTERGLQWRRIRKVLCTVSTKYAWHSIPDPEMQHQHFAYAPQPNWGFNADANIGHAFGISWPMSVPSALRAPAPVNQGVRLSANS